MAPINPVPPEVELEGGLRQACARAEREWLDNLFGCPACGALKPGDLRPATIAPARPFRAITPVAPARPAKVNLKDRVRGRGPLLRMITDERSVSGPAGYGFTSYDLVLFCTACGWTRKYVLTDDPPMRRMSVLLLPEPSGPRTEWRVTSYDGAPAGKVLIGGGEPALALPDAAAVPDARAALALAVVFVAVACRADLSSLPEEHSRRIPRVVVDSMLRLHGGRLAG